MYVTSLLRISVTTTMRATVSLSSPKEEGWLCSRAPLSPLPPGQDNAPSVPGSSRYMGRLHVGMCTSSGSGWVEGGTLFPGA